MSHSNHVLRMEIGGEVYIERRNGTVHLATIKAIDQKTNRILVGFWESENLNLRLKNVDMKKVIQLNKEIEIRKFSESAPSSQLTLEEHDKVQLEPLNLKMTIDVVQSDDLIDLASPLPSRCQPHSSQSPSPNVGILNTSTPTYVSSIMMNSFKHQSTPNRVPQNEDRSLAQDKGQDQDQDMNSDSASDKVEEIEERRHACSTNSQDVMSPVPEVTLPFSDSTVKSKRLLKRSEPTDSDSNDEIKLRKDKFKRIKARQLLLTGNRYPKREQRNNVENPLKIKHYENREQYEIFVLEEMLREEIQFSRDMSKNFIQNIKKLEAQLKDKDKIITKLRHRLEATESHGEDFLLADTDEFVVNSIDEGLQSLA